MVEKQMIRFSIISLFNLIEQVMVEEQIIRVFNYFFIKCRLHKSEEQMILSFKVKNIQGPTLQTLQWYIYLLQWYIYFLQSFLLSKLTGQLFEILPRLGAPFSSSVSSLTAILEDINLECRSPMAYMYDICWVDYLMMTYSQ